MIYHTTSLSNNPAFISLFGNQAQGVISELLKKWKSPSRFYHSLDNHLIPMLDQIKTLPISSSSKHLLEIVAWFHDCVYDPKSKNNELNSVKFFTDRLINKYCADVDIIKSIINMTTNFKCNTPLEGYFANLDLSYFSCTDVKRIVQNELLLLKEFQFIDYSTYKQRRLDILKDLSKTPWITSTTIAQIRGYLKHYKPRIGIYPGSFDPFHIGHLSVLQEAEKLFDKVIVAIGVNPEKHHGIDTDMLQRVRKVLPYHQVDPFHTFLHRYAEEKSKNADITIIRGFRSGYDIDYELTNLAFMRDMSKDVKIVFIAPQKKFDHISSSAIKLIKIFSERQSRIYMPKAYYPSR